MILFEQTFQPIRRNLDALLPLVNFVVGSSPAGKHFCIPGEVLQSRTVVLYGCMEVAFLVSRERKLLFVVLEI